MISRQKQKPAPQENSREGRQSSQAPDADLSVTVGAFAQRFKKKQRQREEADGLAEQAAKSRRDVLLKSMMNIRRSLSQVSNIDLGERFYFTLDADDWQGWPRLILRLEDLVDPRAEHPWFQVMAHDRHEKANVEISWGANSKPLKLSLANENDLTNFPTILKRSVRTYLDVVELIILESEKEPDHDAEQELSQKSVNDFEETPQEKSEDDISGDLFLDDDEGQFDVLEKLPTMGEVQNLSEPEY